MMNINLKRFIQAAIRGAYWFFYPNRKFGIVKVKEDHWYIKHKCKILYLPFNCLPTLEYEHDYERYYKITAKNIIIDAGAGYGDFSWIVVDLCKKNNFN